VVDVTDDTSRKTHSDRDPRYPHREDAWRVRWVSASGAAASRRFVREEAARDLVARLVDYGLTGIGLERRTQMVYGDWQVEQW
jgi:hypothetical protein